jgi:dipeptidase E
MRRRCRVSGRVVREGNLALDRYVLAQAGKTRPKVCFVPTASGDAELYAFHFFEAFTQLDSQPSYLSLFRLPTADLEDFILEKDAIYVGGGNTRSMLALWREWELDGILRKAYESGVVLAGISAGANCWFEECLTDSLPGQIRVLPGLGLLPGSFCPHFDSQKERRPAFHTFLAQGRVRPGLAADDGAAVHYVDEEIAGCVSSRPEAKVYRLWLAGDQVYEEALETRYLDEAGQPNL